MPSQVARCLTGTLHGETHWKTMGYPLSIARSLGVVACGLAEPRCYSHRESGWQRSLRPLAACWVYV